MTWLGEWRLSHRGDDGGRGLLSMYWLPLRVTLSAHLLTRGSITDSRGISGLCPSLLLIHLHVSLSLHPPLTRRGPPAPSPSPDIERHASYVCDTARAAPQKVVRSVETFLDGGIFPEVVSEPKSPIIPSMLANVSPTASRGWNSWPRRENIQLPNCRAQRTHNLLTLALIWHSSSVR